MEKIKEIVKKVCSKEVISYLFWGVVTTLVNLVTFTLLTGGAKIGNMQIPGITIQENIAKAIAIVLAVLVAYVTNRKWVFHSEAKTAKEKWLEFYRFMLARIATMVIEFVGFYLLFNILHIGKDISNIGITVLVVILNYFFSKFFAFRKKEK